MSKRKKIFDIIQIGQRGDFWSRAFDYFIVAVIFLNVGALFLETFEQLAPLHALFRVIEIATVLIFCVEYALRIWTADFLYPDLPRGKAALRFLISYDGIVDLLTILPFFFLSGFVALRFLRVLRIFHLFRINSRYDSFHVITSVLKEKKNALLSSIFIILILMLASSIGMYQVEHAAQPDVFRNALSGIWWSLSTIFTVGYGDIYPVTIIGRTMAVVITFLGVGAVAIPTGIISAGFVEHYTRMQQKSAGRERLSTVSMVLEAGSDFAGHKIREVEVKYDLCVAAVIRNGAVVVPSDNLVMKEGDTVIYQVQQ